MPILKRRLVGAFIGAIVMASLGGCDRSNTKEIVIDGHTFRVPEKYLVKGSIPWLPASQHDGLHFVLNPEARPQEQKIANVISTQTRCQPGTPPMSNMLFLACAAAKAGETEPQEHFSPEKVYPYKGITFQWEYRVKDAEGNQRTVAACTAIDDGKDGSCTSISNYGDMVYSVGLRASEMQRLPEIRAKVRAMLGSWEVRGATESQ